MAYIVLTESESMRETTCKITGLPIQTIMLLENEVSALNLTYINHKKYFEVDVEGVQVLNILSNDGFRVISQSMAIEYTSIGGRSVKIQKIIWTLGKHH